MRHLLTSFFAVLFTGLPMMAFALPSDREKPINIEADHAQMDDRQGVTQYKGDAILTQGTLKITGDVITFFYNENRELEKAVAEGNLATYRQVHKEGDEPVRAKGLQMEYYAGEQKIYLIGDGYVWQSGDEFEGNHIEYDIDRNQVIANSRPVTIGGQEKRSDGRVHVTIQPQGQREKNNQSSTAGNAEPISAPDSESDSAYPIGVIETTLNVRTGPGTSYEKLGKFAANTEVRVLTEQDDWAQVKGFIDGESVIGWVSQRYLSRN